MSCHMCAITVSGGRVTYSGPAAGLQEYAAKIYLRAQMGPPPIANAPEVFLELCDMLIKNEKLDLAIVDTERKETNDKSIAELSIADDKTTANNYFYETYIIFSRNLKNIIRTKELFLARIGAAVGFGFLIGSLFYRRPLTDVGVTERVAYLVFTIAFFCYTSLETLPIFLAEREIFQREYSRGAYRAISYVTAVSLVHIPFLSVLGFMFAVTSYWLVMLPNRAETFLFFVLTLLCTNIAAQSFAVLVSVLVSDPITGRTVGYTIFSVMLLLSGFFVTQDNIPYCWSWIHYSSILKYSYESFVVNILLDKIETSTRTNGQIMMMLSMESISRWRGVGVLLGFALLYRLAFYAALIRYHNGRRTE
jgi:ABC-type multidrug transport system permease subunit